MDVHYSDHSRMIFTLCGYTDKNPDHAIMASSNIVQVTCLDCLRLLASKE